ncbi:reverse transcriptase domain-containing protein [Tanacetum coccineum]
MRTRSQSRNRNRQQQAQPAVVQPFHLEEPFVNPPLVPMADNRTMAQLLQAPTEGYEFFGHDKEDPHAHIRYFNKITSTMRFPDIPSTSIKLMLFPFSLEGSARIWLEKEPPRSILTWDDLVSKFINQFFPPSKTTNLRTLPSQTVTNPREHVNAITTRSGKTYEGPSTPLVPTFVVSTPLKEPKQKPPKKNAMTRQKPSFRNNENPLFNEMVEDVVNENSNVSNSDEPVFLNTPFSDKVGCSDPEVDIDEIDAFLAMEVSSNFEEGYYDSEGDVIFLESLLGDDTTYNLDSEVIFNHEPKQNESIHNPSITFSPKSDPLHHEFTGEIITIPPRIVREHEDYINRMSLLCSNSSSQSPKIFHTIIESLPTSTTLIEDSDPNREEIDIFSGPDDSIPPGIESDFDSEEDIIDNLLNENPTHKRLTFNIEPNTPVINNVDELNEDECFDPGGGENNVEVDDSFTIVTRTFLPFLTYPEVSPLLSSAGNEDTIFDPDIST